MTDVFSGIVSNVVYENEGFRILKMSLDGVPGLPVAVKGDFQSQEVEVGTWLSFEGVWKEDPPYGKQLTVLRSPAPTIKWTDESSLSALSAQGVGPTTRMSLQIWAKSRGVSVPSALDSGILEGLSVDDKTRDHLLERWKSLRTYLDAATFMADAGIPQAVVSKVWAVLGDDFEKAVTEDPWILVSIAGISFKEADVIASKLGVPLNNPGRVRGAVLSASREILSDGHVFSTTRQIVDLVSASIPNPVPTPQDVAQAIVALRDQGAILVDREVSPGVVALYDKWHHKVEQQCAEILCARLKTPPHPDLLTGALCKVGDAVRDLAASGAGIVDLADQALRWWAAGKKVSLTPQQQAAAVQALVSPISVLTGLPGTGKTTTLMAVVSVLQDMGTPLLLIAPTGIAAKRMSSVTGAEASTIHRAFGAKGFQRESEDATYVGIVRDPGKKQTRSDSDLDGDWGYGPNRHHPAKVAIVDECSMLDLHMLYRVLTSTDPSCRIVFVGDPYQLPSVGSGDVLRDLVNSGAFPHSHLDQIFRQEGTSGIVIAAHDVHAGRSVNVDGKDFLLLDASSEDEASSLIVRVSQKLYEKGSNFQVLSPRHAGEAGVTSLNQKLRIALNPALSGVNEHRLGGSVVREGDRIMIVKNDHDKGVYNGDVGKISRIDKKTKEIEVKIFEGVNVPPRQVRFEFKTASKSLRLAYAQTVHKSQGQEYDVIVIPMLPSFGRQLQRNLFYTAITRAKKKVFVIGTVGAIDRAIQNNRADSRNSFLGLRIETQITGGITQKA